MSIDSLVWRVCDEDKLICRSPEGPGILLDMLDGEIWNWKASDDYMSSVGDGQAKGRHNALIQALNALQNAGINLDMLPVFEGETLRLNKPAMHLRHDGLEAVVYETEHFQWAWRVLDDGVELTGGAGYDYQDMDVAMDDCRGAFFNYIGVEVME